MIILWKGNKPVYKAQGVQNKYTDHMYTKYIIGNITNVDKLERKKYGIDIYIQFECCGITKN